MTHQSLHNRDTIFMVMELVTGGDLFDRVVAHGPMKVGGLGRHAAKAAEPKNQNAEQLSRHQLEAHVAGFALPSKNPAAHGLQLPAAPPPQHLLLLRPAATGAGGPPRVQPAAGCCGLLPPAGERKEGWQVAQQGRPSAAACRQRALLDTASIPLVQGIYHRDLKPENVLLDSGVSPPA